MVDAFLIPRRGDRLRQAAVALAAVAASAGLGGCDPGNAVTSTVDFYHSLQGGVIADERPPPPGVDDPYPKVASIPPRPAAPDITAQERLSDQLAAQRDAASRLAAQNPVTALPAPKPATPAAKPPAAATPADAPPSNRVVVDAAPAPAATTTAAKPAAAGAQGPSVPPLPDISSLTAIPATVASGPLPNFAAAPPPAPGNVGLEIPVAPPAAANAPPPAASAPAGGVVIVFTPGSAMLPPSATLDLRRFALAHRGGNFNITGHGEVVLPTLESQSRALDLGLRRAQAIAGSLSAAGVPASNLHLHAEAAGQGGMITL